MDRERANNLYMATVADHAQRYEDMVQFLKKIVMLDVELTAKERYVLCAGYKNLISDPQSSWYIVSAIQEKEEGKGNVQNAETAKYFRQAIEEELTGICNDILDIIQKHLIPSSTSADAIVFCHKMKGDYYRYFAEFKTGQERDAAADHSLRSYQMATDIANNNLPPTHPSRLGLALNFAVFYHDIMKSTEKACEMAEKAFEDSIAELDVLRDERYDDSTLIMQMLKDNIALWLNY